MRTEDYEEENMDNEDKRIIEINGVKLEVDMRTAKRVDTFKVGDPVKILCTEYQNQSVVRPGVIVGFAEFASGPAIEIMMLKDEYNGVSFEFITMSKETKKYEICLFNRYEKLFMKGNVLDRFDKEVEKKRLEIEEIKLKKEYFINEFQKAFSEIPCAQ